MGWGLAASFALQGLAAQGALACTQMPTLGKMKAARRRLSVGGVTQMNADKSIWPCRTEYDFGPCTERQ